MKRSEHAMPIPLRAVTLQGSPPTALRIEYVNHHTGEVIVSLPKSPGAWRCEECGDSACAGHPTPRAADKPRRQSRTPR